jgi:YjbE family integral membrane protein
MMAFFSPEFFTALLSIIVIDLVLAGDNAIVIGLAARNVPKASQNKVIWWGTAGAIIIRIIATLLVVQLLKIPGLLLVGGLLLIWISYKLLTDDKDHTIEAKHSTWGAIRTIIIADAVMGLDNVIAIAGASHGSFSLVVIGLLISVPIVVWGSTLFIKLINKYPAVIYVGAGILAFTAAKMIVEEKFILPFFESNGLAKWLFISLIVAGVVGVGRIKALSISAVIVSSNGDIQLPVGIIELADVQPGSQFEAEMNDSGKITLISKRNHVESNQEIYAG